MPSQYSHTVDPVYASPVLRAPSPVDSINTEYGPDETTPADKSLSDEAFARSVEEQLGLRNNTWSDIPSLKPVILPRTKDSREEQIMFDIVIKNLRDEVKKLEDEELFESAIQKNLDTSPFGQGSFSHSVDDILRSMLPKSNTNVSPPKESSTADGNRSTSKTV